MGWVDELEGGGGFFCARIATQLWCWGANDSYQTGIGTSTQPQRIPALVEQVTAVSDVELGASHACVILGGGSVHCWGNDAWGQLGDNDDDPDPRAAPTPVRGLPVGASQLTAGWAHTCALVGTTVYCWGDGRRGQLGQGDLDSSDIALSIPGLPPIVRIEAGLHFTCAIDDEADMWCWGDGT